MKTEDDRRAMKQAMPKVYLQDKHVSSCRTVSRREDLLDLLPKGGVAAEIGVAFGDFTAEIVARTRPSKLHLVDLWGSARYEDGLRQIQEKFSSEIATGSVEINRGMSIAVLKTFPDAYFDWVYIDTDHSYRTTAEELRLSAAKVRPGGRIAGHDFTSGNVVGPVPYGVIEACNEFCMKQGWAYEFMTLEPHGHQSFCLKQL
jgi:Methyltransferase domain